MLQFLVNGNLDGTLDVIIQSYTLDIQWLPLVLTEFTDSYLRFEVWFFKLSPLLKDLRNYFLNQYLTVSDGFLLKYTFTLSAKVNNCGYFTQEISVFVFLSSLFSPIWSGRGSAGQRRVMHRSGFSITWIKMWSQLLCCLFTFPGHCQSDLTTPTQSWWAFDC